MSRRTILIVIAVLVLIGLLVAGYFFFFGKNVAPETGIPTDPFGVAGEYQGTGSIAPEVGVEQSNAGEEVAPRLVRITPEPVAYGALAITVTEIVPGVGTTTATTTVTDTEVRYVERASGNVYAYRSNARTLTRLTNQTLPGIEEAAWAPDGSRVFLRFLTTDSGVEEVETYALPVSGEAGYFLENNLSNVVTGNSLLTVKPNANGSVGTVAGLNGSSAKTLFTSVLSSLRVFPGGASYGAYTNASAHTDGYGFLITSGGVFERVVGPAKGLTLLPSPTGKYFLYGSVSGTRLELSLLTLTTREITSLPLGALPEKCVWALSETVIYCAVPRAVTGTVPDDWYQGALSFSDRIWRIDLTARIATLVFDPSVLAETDIDAVNLAVDPEADVLTFTNRKDGSLWLYDL